MECLSNLLTNKKIKYSNLHILILIYIMFATSSYFCNLFLKNVTCNLFCLSGGKTITLIMFLGVLKTYVLNTLHLALKG